MLKDYPKVVDLDYEDWQKAVKSSRINITEAKDFSELLAAFSEDRARGGNVTVMLDTIARMLELLSKKS